MFFTLLGKELRENIQNHRFTIALIICTLLIPVSFTFNLKKIEARRAVYEESVSLYEQTRKTVLDVRREGAAVFRPPSPLILIATGVEYLLPDEMETVGFISNRGIQIRNVNTSSFSNPLSALYGHLDLNFFGCMVLSILAIFFTSGSIAGEKETGSLGQIVSNAVPRPVILLAKTAAADLLLGTAFFTGLLAGFLVLQASGYPLLANPAILRAFLLAGGLCLLFIMVMVHLGLFVSTLLKNSITSVIVLIVCWAWFTLILPKGAVILSKMIRPVTSQQVIDMEKNQLRLNLRDRMDQEVQERANSDPNLWNLSNREFFNALNAGGRAEKKYVEDTDAIQARFQSDLSEGLRGIDRKYRLQRNAQAAIARNIARLSPASCFTHFLVELSRTGTLAAAQWESTHRQLLQLLDGEIASHHKTTQFKNMSTSRFDMDRDAPAPRVVYTEVPFQSIFKQTWPDLLLLALYGILFFTGAFTAFMRYDVR